MSKELYMQRCIDLAMMGLGQTSPNPMVGCVIVHQNKIIGEGYHQKFGNAHAEVNAINDAIQKHNNYEELFKNSEIYINLEPCSHQGKTPPCVDLLLKYKFKKVYIANTDPNPLVNGKGIEQLKDAGIAVEIGLLENKGKWLNRRFFTRITKQRPYIILKWAQTKNGYFAPNSTSQQWITGNEAKALVHLWRTEEDAVLVGKNTALIDNPKLTARLVEGKNPIRVLIDKNLAVPHSNSIFDQQAKTIIFNEIKTAVEGNLHFIQIEDMVFYLAEKISYQLYILDIQSVIIEGGANILNQFIQNNLWDEARIFTSNTAWEQGVQAPQIRGTEIENLQIGNDNLKIFVPQ